MQSPSKDASAPDAVVERARGVLAERFGVEIATADAILCDVARLEEQHVADLAAAVVASCTELSLPLPRRLYTNGDGIDGSA
jgi:hypothetical protein